MGIVDKMAGLLTGRTERQVIMDRLSRKVNGPAAVNRLRPVYGGRRPAGCDNGEIIKKIGLTAGAAALFAALGVGGYEAYRHLVEPGQAGESGSLAEITPDGSKHLVVATLSPTATPGSTPTATKTLIPTRPAEEHSTLADAQATAEAAGVVTAVPTKSAKEKQEELRGSSFDLDKYRKDYPGANIRVVQNGSLEMTAYVLYVDSSPVAVETGSEGVVDIRQQAEKLRDEANSTGKRQSRVIPAGQRWARADEYDDQTTVDQKSLVTGEELAAAGVTIVQAGEGSQLIGLTKELAAFLRANINNKLSKLVIVGVPGVAVDTLALVGDQYTDEMRKVLREYAGVEDYDTSSVEALNKLLSRYEVDSNAADFVSAVYGGLDPSLSRIVLGYTGAVVARKDNGKGAQDVFYLFVPVATKQDRLSAYGWVLSCAPRGEPVIDFQGFVFGYSGLDMEGVMNYHVGVQLSQLSMEVEGGHVAPDGMKMAEMFQKGLVRYRPFPPEVLVFPNHSSEDGGYWVGLVPGNM